MKKIFVTWIALATILLLPLAPMVRYASAAGPVTKEYGDLTLNSPSTSTHWEDVWDLTQGDLTLRYTIDMTGLHQPGTWKTYDGSTSYTEVGLRGEGATDFNPGPWNTYQGNCGGYMVSDSDTWLDSDGFTERGNPCPDSIADLDDKHGLQASGGRGERDYDVLLSDPDTVLNPPIGSFDNYGIWFDRDGVDPYQDNDPSTPPPYGSSVPWSQQDGRKTYDTGGIYDIVVTYHAIDAGLGVMFATVNGVPQGFYETWHGGAPDYYPAGLSFKGDMKHMQVFAGLWAPDASYGPIGLSGITVNGFSGVSDPLVPDFTYAPAKVIVGDTVQFTDATHGGMPPYSYAWDFDSDGTVDSTDQNPTHVFAAEGTYTVRLTVTPCRCTPKSVTRTIQVCCFKVTSITPNPAMQHTFPCCSRIYGCCFEQGARVRLEKGSAVINPLVVQYVSGGEVDAVFNLVGAAPGKYDVVVTNPDGRETRLVEGFEITPSCGAGAGSATIMFGVAVGLLSVAGSGQLFRRKRRGRA